MSVSVVAETDMNTITLETMQVTVRWFIVLLQEIAEETIESLPQ